MNPIYRLVWNAVQQRRIVAPESARGGHGGSSLPSRAKSLCVALLAAFAEVVGALPVDGVVVGGSGAISQNAKTLTVNQATPKLAVNWQGFNIGAGEAVNFVQPGRSAIALNRVLGAEASSIYGQLTANGQVFLVNSNGILFGRGAQVNVGGLVASTLDLSVTDFMSGQRTFSGSGGRIDNLGSLSAAEGGYIALLGGQVSNQGTITANLGTVALAAGSRVSLDFAGDKLLSLQVEQSAINSLVENSQLIQADGGQVILTTRAAGEVLSGVVNNTGIVQAKGISNENGVIRLSGDVVINTGTLDASGNAGTNGGTIEASGRSLLQAGAIRADGANGGSVKLSAEGALIQTAAGEISANGAGEGGSVALTGGSAAFLSGSVAANGESGGQVSVTAPQLTLAATKLSADGTTDGGTLLVGGDAHGANAAIANAQTTIVNPYATLSAQGKQGKIVVWSDQDTLYYGSAMTGARGFIEVSGKQKLAYGGKSNAGEGGNVLLDPTNLVIDNSAQAMFYLDLVNPNPAASETHGSGGVVELTNGNIVVASPNDNLVASQAGAVYLYNGKTGALISALTGSKASDRVGSGDIFSGASVCRGGVTALTGNGNFVVSSPYWDGAAADVGAVTWVGTAGLSGAVSSANSLVGSKESDYVGGGEGGGVVALTKGNYVVVSPYWDSTVSNVGAVTWGNGATGGLTGAVSNTNSLVGSTSGDKVGYYNGFVLGVTALADNGNYVVASPYWRNVSLGRAWAGAATWGNGSGGTVGTINSSNSLIGDHAADMVGAFVTALTNGNYVVGSSGWYSGRGAATWGNGSNGVTGTINSGNSLIGAAGDYVGGSVTALSDGNYVVVSTGWSGGRGAVTRGNGVTEATRTTGTVTSGNSLIGSTAYDQVGYAGVTALADGNYVVASPNWDNGTVAANVGAVTWVNGSGSTAGTVSSDNSLVGSNASDQVGSGGVTRLSNDNYVVASPNWKNGSAAKAGAVTWGSGTAGITGAVTSSNSLVGSKQDDQVGITQSGSGRSGVTALALNGNYVVRSPLWNGGVGAATWVRGTAGITGAVTSGNSLVGNTSSDGAGTSVTALANGNYVVASPNWDNGAVTNVGAVTWGSGTSGITGAVTSSNSLVGSTADDQLGSDGVVALAVDSSKGNYVVKSSNYDLSEKVDAGAVWLVADPSNLETMVNGSAGSPTLSPAALAAAAVANSTLTLQASDNITVNSAINVAGALNLIAGNDLTLNAGITSAATGTALQLASKSFINNAGSNALSAANGRWLVWSTTPADDTRGSLAYDFKQYGATYGSTAAAQVNGNGFLYSTAPVITASLTGSVSKVYDATTAATLTAANYTSSGAIDGDSVTFNNTVGTYDNKNVAASGKDVTVSGLAIASATNGTAMVYGYQLASTSINGAIGAITPADLAVSGISASNKVYDASTNATLSGTARVSALGSDAVVVAGTGSGSFADKNVGTAKSVTVSGYTLSGADAGNYVIAQPSGLTADISAASLAVSGISASNKVYDATTNASLSGTASVSALGSDVVSVAGTGSGSFADKNVGTAKSVTVSGYTLSGADAGNYVIAQPSGLTADISAASLAVSGISASNKVYDATTNATLSGTASVSALGSDVVVVAGTGSGSFADKNVGMGKAVSVSGYTLSGADAGNYVIVQPSGLAADISVASLAVSGVSANNKAYDATTNATLSGTASVSALGSDAVSVAGAGSGSFADKNVGTGKAVSVSGYTLSGADAGNYVIVQPSGLTADIRVASLAVSGISASNKVYDASTNATLSGTASVSALGSDAVSIAGTGSGSFADKNVGTAKAVSVSGYTLSGANAGNYVIVQPSGLTADISAASLAVSGVSANNKVYDATTNASLSGTASVSALGSDAVVVAGSGSGSFADKNVGTAKSVTVSGYTLSGADAGNYVIVQPSGLTADIRVASLAVSGVSASNKVYDATTNATLSGTARVSALGSDVVSVAGTGSGSFADKNVCTAKSVTVSGYTLSGADAGNYVIAQPSGLTADISAASLAVSGVSASNKVYDATTNATLSGTARVSALGSDAVVVAGTGSGSFADKNVGTGKAVSVSGYTLSGADAGNYVIVQPSGLTADIRVASLAVSGISASNKVYDATTNATLSGTASVSALGSDVVVVAGTGSGSFADKNVGMGKAVSVSGYTLSGADAGNYVIVQPSGLAADISARTLNVTYGGVNKVYDGTVAASVTSADDRLGGDVLTISRNAAFIDANVGVAKPVNVSGASLSGAAAGNYVLASTTGTTSADITAAPRSAPTPTPEIVALENARSDLSRTPPDTVKLCCTTDTVGIAEQCDRATKPPNPLDVLIVVDGGVKRTNDIWATLY